VLAQSSDHAGVSNSARRWRRLAGGRWSAIEQSRLFSRRLRDRGDALQWAMARSQSIKEHPILALIRTIM